MTLLTRSWLTVVIRQRRSFADKKIKKAKTIGVNPRLRRVDAPSLDLASFFHSLFFHSSSLSLSSPLSLPVCASEANEGTS